MFNTQGEKSNSIFLGYLTYIQTNMAKNGEQEMSLYLTYYICKIKKQSFNLLFWFLFNTHRCVCGRLWGKC